MQKQVFSIRINRKRTINGRLLAGMSLTESYKYFEGNKKLTKDEIKTAHAKAVKKAKELDGEEAEVAPVKS